MECEVDHYIVLGLPSGEEGAKLTDKEIAKAYKLKALELHPDKRPDDPNAHANFQKLMTSYEILKDEKARNLFNILARVKREKVQRQEQQDPKRQKMMYDLVERERAAFAPDASTRAQEDEESIARKLKEEIARIRSMYANKGSAAPATPVKDTVRGVKESTKGRRSDQDEKILRVSWEKIVGDYTIQKLRELFEKFGRVEDIVIKSSKKKGLALVVMASKEAAVSVLATVLGDYPLLVMPLQPVQQAKSPACTSSARKGVENQAFEASVLEKLKKAAQRQMYHDKLSVIP